MARQLHHVEAGRPSPARRTLRIHSAGRRYRYYVAGGRQTGDHRTSIRRVAAEALDRWALLTVRRISGQAALAAATLAEALLRIELGDEETQLVIAVVAFAGRHRDLLLTDVQRRLRAGERVVWEDADQAAIRCSLPPLGDGLAVEAIPRR